MVVGAKSIIQELNNPESLPPSPQLRKQQDTTEMILQDVYFHTQQLQNNDVKYSWIHSRTRRRYPSFLVDMPWWSHSDHTAVTHTTNLSAAAERIGRSFWISYRTATENVLCQLTGFRQWHCVFLSFPMAWMWTWLPRKTTLIFILQE